MIIKCMVKEKQYIVMVDLMKEIILRIKCMGRENLVGQMEDFMKESISEIKNKDLVYSKEQMVEPIKDSGKAALCMDKEL